MINNQLLYYSFTPRRQVNLSTKIIVFFLLLAVNCFFIAYSCVYCLLRDLRFQQGLLKACLFQMIVEIFFYETTEVVFVQVFLPIFGLQHIRKAIDIIRTCTQAQSKFYLNIGNYFFVSAQLSRIYPLSAGKN